MMSLLDKAIQNRIGRGVDNLVQKIFSRDDLDNARFLGRPKVLPPPPQGILRFREHLVEVFAELHIVAMPVEEHRVMMIGHHLRNDSVHLEALRGLGQQIGERVVRCFVGAK